MYIYAKSKNSKPINDAKAFSCPYIKCGAMLDDLARDATGILASGDICCLLTFCYLLIFLLTWLNQNLVGGV